MILLLCQFLKVYLCKLLSQAGGVVGFFDASVQSSEVIRG